MRYSFLFIVILFLSQCSHFIKKEPKGFEQARFWKDQQQRAQLLNKISAKMTIYYEWKEKGIGGRANLLAHMPKNLRLEIRDPIGRLQHVLTLSKPKVVAYFPSNKVVYYDDQGGSLFFRRFFGAKMTVSDFHSLLVGVIPKELAKANFDEWHWNGKRGLYEGVLKSQKEKLIAFIDPERGMASEIIMENVDTVVKIEYGDFQSCCGATEPEGKLKLAFSLTLSNKNPRSSIDVTWQKLRFTKNTPKPELFSPDFPILQ